MPLEASQIQDPGLFSLTLLLRFFDRTIEIEQIRQRCGTDTIGVPEMVRSAEAFGFKACVIKPNWKNLSRAALPGIATLRNGGFLILGKLAEDKVLI